MKCKYLKGITNLISKYFVNVVHSLCQVSLKYLELDRFSEINKRKTSLMRFVVIFPFPVP